MTPGGLASLRRLISRRVAAAEHCELCSAVVAEEHQHLVDPTDRRLLCVCDPCAILFDRGGSTRYLRVPRDVRELTGIEISESFWTALAIPVGLVFLFRSSISGQVLAVYPSPAGPTEAGVEKQDWEELAALHTALPAMKPDVEALLVNRVAGMRRYYLVPIDEAYRLTGLIRKHWRGFSGGEDAQERIGVYFDGLDRRSVRKGTGRHA